jgi:hypothetical protein
MMMYPPLRKPQAGLYIVIQDGSSQNNNKKTDVIELAFAAVCCFTIAVRVIGFGGVTFARSCVEAQCY